MEIFSLDKLILCSRLEKDILSYLISQRAHLFLDSILRNLDCPPFSDSNWAGCHDTRKSTSGAAILHGSHLIKAYGRTQSNVALSSGEAEFYALVSAASESLGLVAMTEDFGDKAGAQLYADASAAIGIANREGLGRIRHLDTQSLWLQQALRQRRLGVGKVLGTENPSDLMTKHTDAKVLEGHVKSMGCEFAAGRAELAPQAVR